MASRGSAPSPQAQLLPGCGPGAARLCPGNALVPPHHPRATGPGARLRSPRCSWTRWRARRCQFWVLTLTGSLWVCEARWAL